MGKNNSSEFLRGKPTNGNREQIFAAMNKIFALVLIFTGLWVSTQYFAYLLGYDPVFIGYPFIILRSKWFTYGTYPLYAPWEYFSWLIQYIAKEDIAIYLKKAIIPWLVISFSAIVLYTIITYFRGFKQAAEKCIRYCSVGNEKRSGERRSSWKYWRSSVWSAF